MSDRKKFSPKKKIESQFIPSPSLNQKDFSPEDEEDGRPSKTAKKREMHALQIIGKELSELSRDALKKIPMSIQLADEIEAVQKITAHEGKRRQMQYIGKVMRTLSENELDQIHEALSRLKGESKIATAELHEIERWRTQLIASDDLMTEFMARYSYADSQQGRALIRQCRHEINLQKPPRAQRELFQWIKQVLEKREDIF